MAVIANASSQSFAPQKRVIPFSVAANLTLVTLTLTHPEWPTGQVLALELFWGGVPAGQFRTSGGPRKNKDGSPRTAPYTTTFTTAKPPGLTSGEVHVTVLQTLTAAILVEGF